MSNGNNVLAPDQNFVESMEEHLLRADDREMWKKVFLAAIAGRSARMDDPQFVVPEALAIADASISEYRKRKI